MVITVGKLFAITVLSAAAGLSQGPPTDTRPVGKYLVRVCSWTPGRNDVTCKAPGAIAGPAQGIPQSIEFKQVASADGSAGGDPAYPLTVGGDFFVSAKATSGLRVDVRAITNNVQEIASGPLGNGVHQFRVTGDGSVILEATRGAESPYQAAAPVQLVFDVGPAPKPACGGLFPVAPSPRTVQTVDGGALVQLLGTPAPYVLTASGPNTILIYTTRSVFEPTREIIKTEETEVKKVVTERETKTTRKTASQNPSEEQVLHSLEDQMKALLTRTTDSLGLVMPKPFSVELSIPHAQALGDLAARINGLNYSQFTVADVGTDKVRISAPAQPECALWTSFLKDIRAVTVQLSPEPSSMRLYYVGQNGMNGSTQTGASDVSKAFTTLGSGGGGGSAPAAGAATATAAPKPPSIATADLEGDLLVFSSSNPGDDAQIAERKRIIAQLDLPRPEMIVNGWVLQNSTTNSEANGAFTSMVKELVSNFNERFENVVLFSWDHIRRRIAAGDYFENSFYHYISDRYVGDSSPASVATSAQDAAQQFLTSHPAKLVFPDGTNPQDYGICETGHYCLGYSGLFQPVKPRLTDTLLALVAARDTLGELTATINAVEGPAPALSSVVRGYCDTLAADQRDECRSLWKDLDLDRPGEIGQSCENDDLRLILWSTFNDAPLPYQRSRVYLRCFLKQAQKYLMGSGPSGAQAFPTGVGLMRAAVANFLFNYKVSQQYPHEFDSYSLSQSADALNSALNPLIDAFNRDLATYQRFVRGEVRRRVEQINRDFDQRCCAKRLFSLDKPSFYNDGIVTVRTISGQWTYASTVSQNFLNTMAAPKLTDVLNSLTGTGGAAPAQASSAPISALLPTKPGLASAQLGAAFLNNFQNSYAQIGRALSISAIPRSLATASSAEIVVSLNVDDQAGTGVYSGGPQNGANANISRVSNSDTSTRVRVESVKLFEISSASAVLQKSRSRFPLVPPLVELPYIGTLAGIPLPAAKEFHQTAAVLSAVVVPTAADIAYGLEFQFDEVAEGETKACSILRVAGDTERCRLRRILSIHDFGPGRSVTRFNGMTVRCLATEQRSGYASIGGFTPAAANACANISLDTVAR